MKAISTPKQLITTTIISKELQNQHFDIEVTYTVFGEVLATKSLFSTLPETAQKFLVGSEVEVIHHLLESHAKLLPYFFPLIALDYLKEGAWQMIHTKINELKITNPNYANYQNISIREKWIKAIYQLASQQPKHELFKHLVALADNDPSESKRRNGIYFLRKPRSPLPPHFINILFPTLIVPEEIEVAYSSFKGYLTEQNFQFLFERLKSQNYQKYWPQILEGLKGYTHQELEDYLLDFYSKHSNDTALTKKIIACLGHFSSRKVIHFLKDAVVHGVMHASLNATTALRNQNVSNETITKLINPRLRQPTSIREVLKYFRVYEYLQGDVDYISADEILNLIEWSETQKEAFNFGLNYILKKVFQEKNFPRLLRMLKSKSPKVSNSALKVLTEVGRKEHIKEVPPLLNELELPYFDSKLVCLNKLLKRYTYPPIVSVLIDKLTTIKSLPFEKRILEVLGTALRENPMEIAIKPLFKYLDHAHPPTRKLAVYALRYYGDYQEVIEKLQTLLKDPEAIVKEAAQWNLDRMLTPEKVIAEKREALYLFFKEVVLEGKKDKNQLLTDGELLGSEKAKRQAFDEHLEKYPSTLKDVLYSERRF